MEFGVGIFFTEYSISPAELAVALEERGFESLWAPEHSHIPTSRRTPTPGGGELTTRYYDVMDPFVTLTAAAAVTKRLKLGTGVCLVIQRDTIQTAKSSRRSTKFQTGAFCSASAAAGTPRKWRITARYSRPVSRKCANRLPQ
jgi:Luciferase-like monooxygenase